MEPTVVRQEGGEMQIRESLCYLWQRFLDIYTDPVPPEWHLYTAEQIVEWCKTDSLSWEIWRAQMDKREAEFPVWERRRNDKRTTKG